MNGPAEPVTLVYDLAELIRAQREGRDVFQPEDVARDIITRVRRAYAPRPHDTIEGVPI